MTFFFCLFKYVADEQGGSSIVSIYTVEKKEISFPCTKKIAHDGIKKCRNKKISLLIYACAQHKSSVLLPALHKIHSIFFFSAVCFTFLTSLLQCRNFLSFMWFKKKGKKKNFPQRHFLTYICVFFLLLFFCRKREKERKFCHEMSRKIMDIKHKYKQQYYAVCVTLLS